MNSDDSSGKLTRRKVFWGYLKVSWDYLRPSIGYLMTVFLCYSVGLSLHEQLSLELKTLIRVIRGWLPFCILLLPYYINREILDNPSKKYQSHASDKAFIDRKRRVGAVVLGLCLLIFVIIVIVTIFSFQQVEFIRETTIGFLVTTIPFIVIGFYTTYQWPKEVSFSVRYRWFFPALLTCAIPFLVGWTYKSGLTLLELGLGLGGFDLVLIVFWAISLIPFLTKKTDWFWLVGIIILLLYVIVAFFIPIREPISKVFKMSIFGILITMVMAISESWRLTTREPSLDLASKYRVGTNFATSIFPPAFLLTILHPHTNTLYSIAICLFLSAQYLVWFARKNIWTSNFWFRMKLAFGYAFPILIWLGVSESPCIPSIEILGGIRLYGAVTVIAFLCAYFIQEWKDSYKRCSRFWDTFKQTKNSVAFTGLVSTFISILAVLFLWSTAKVCEQRFNLLISMYILLGIVLFVVHLIIDKKRQMQSQI